MGSYKVTKSTSKSSKKRPRKEETRKGKESKKEEEKKAAPPRQDSPQTNNPCNFTTYLPNQGTWSWTNLPDILYQLGPTDKGSRYKKAGQMSYKIHGKYLRDLPVLPDNISSSVEEFRVEAWQRLDQRIRLDDITARMHPDFRVKNNALQQRGVRFRQNFSLLAWRSGNKRTLDFGAVLLQRMNELGLDYRSNSTRGITPGLIHPELGEAGGRVLIPTDWYAKKLGLDGDNQTKKVKGQPMEMEIEVSPKNLEVLPEAPEALPKVQEVPEHEAQVIEQFLVLIKCDEHHNNSNGTSPMFRDLILDEELPTTVNMRDLNLRLGCTRPTKQEDEPMPLMSNQRRPNWSSSSSLPHRGLCNYPCFRYYAQQPQEFLDYIHPDFATTPSKPQTPTTDIFPMTNPIQLNMVPEEGQKSVFDITLAEYYKGERQLAEMPYILVSPL